MIEVYVMANLIGVLRNLNWSFEPPSYVLLIVLRRSFCLFIINEMCYSQSRKLIFSLSSVRSFYTVFTAVHIIAIWNVQILNKSLILNKFTVN